MRARWMQITTGLSVVLCTVGCTGRKEAEIQKQISAANAQLTALQQSISETEAGFYSLAKQAKELEFEKRERRMEEARASAMSPKKTSHEIEFNANFQRTLTLESELRKERNKLDDITREIQGEKRSLTSDIKKLSDGLSRNNLLLKREIKSLKITQ